MFLINGISIVCANAGTFQSYVRNVLFFKKQILHRVPNYIYLCGQAGSISTIVYYAAIYLKLTIG